MFVPPGKLSYPKIDKLLNSSKFSIAQDTSMQTRLSAIDREEHRVDRLPFFQDPIGMSYRPRLIVATENTSGAVLIQPGQSLLIKTPRTAQFG